MEKEYIAFEVEVLIITFLLLSNSGLYIEEFFKLKNKIMIIASNRIGSEVEGDSSMTFFGSSFIANEEGTKVKEMDRVTEGFITYSFDLTEIEKKRYSWGVYRDRRVDLYTPILKTDDSK